MLVKHNISSSILCYICDNKNLCFNGKENSACEQKGNLYIFVCPVYPGRSGERWALYHFASRTVYIRAFYPVYKPASATIPVTMYSA